MNERLVKIVADILYADLLGVRLAFFDFEATEDPEQFAAFDVGDDQTVLKGGDFKDVADRDISRMQRAADASEIQEGEIHRFFMVLLAILIGNIHQNVGQEVG